jgi:tetratricopeptide (TPR) repeat protein
MLLGRVAFTACLMFATAIASAETGDKANASTSVNAGFQSDSHASTAKTEVKVDAKASGSPEAKPESTKATDTVTKDAAGVRRDPKGKKGISPFWEAVRRGDEAALARDYAKAEAAYQEALGIEPKNALAHFRKGQILVRAGKLTDAETVYQDAMRLAGSDKTLHAAALFVLADLKERQGQRDAAITAWKAYADFLKSEATAKGYPETAVERDKRLKTYNQLVVDSKAVRERIDLRVKELEAAAKRQAAKNPNLNK